MELTLERNADAEDKGEVRTPLGTLYIGGTNDWAYRVVLSEKQAIIGFPKFSTIGIGFAEEENWNTNLPFSCDTKEIFDHIAQNKGDDNISDEDCITAIGMIQQAVKHDRAAQPFQDGREYLVKPLAQALRDEFPIFLGIGIAADDEAWTKAARGIITKLGADSHEHYEEYSAPAALTFTFADVPLYDMETGKVIAP